MKLPIRLPDTRLVRRAKLLVRKAGQDNLGFLTAVVAWNALTSLVPIVVGLIAISGFMLQGNPATQHSVVVHLSAALHGVLTPRDLTQMVHTTVNHSGLFGVIGIVGVLWGGSNVGGALSAVFQAVFETGGRNFVKEKILDIVMIFVITGLMLVIIVGTTQAAIINRLVSNFPLSAEASFAAGVAISIVAGFVLFATIYIAFPNTGASLRLRHVWQGALLAAVLFELLTLVWPIYAHFSHFSRYGAVLFPILLLTAWIYFFSTIVLIGAEVVAVSVITESNRRHLPLGPEPQSVVPQHRVLRRT